MMRTTVWTTALLLLLCAAACNPPPVMMMTGHPLGGACAANADCQSTLCLEPGGVGLCTATCASDADCTGTTGGLRFVCGVGPDGASVCVPPCGMLRYTCVDAVSTSCSVVTDDSHCIDCRCSDSTTHCVRDVGCMPPGPVGAACRVASDCQSHDCSAFAGVCRVAVGATCDATNCDACLHLPGGTTHCSRECASAVDCGRDACVGDTTLMQFECRPSSCPIGSTTCTVERAPHDVGQSCHADSDCGSGQCFASQRCVGTDCIGEGWCTSACSGDGDCAAGTRCATIPCASGQTSACGTICLKECSGFTDCGVYGGACAAVEDTRHMLVNVCDVRHTVGMGCTADRECVSTHCASGTCGT